MKNILAAMNIFLVANVDMNEIVEHYEKSQVQRDSFAQKKTSDSIGKRTMDTTGRRTRDTSDGMSHIIGHLVLLNEGSKEFTKNEDELLKKDKQ